MMSFWLVPTAPIRLRLSLRWKPLCSTAIAMIKLATNIRLVACNIVLVSVLMDVRHQSAISVHLEIVPGHLVRAGDPGQGEEHQGQQGGDGERHQLEYPEHGHHLGRGMSVTRDTVPG